MDNTFHPKMVFSIFMSASVLFSIYSLICYARYNDYLLFLSKFISSSPYQYRGLSEILLFSLIILGYGLCREIYRKSQDKQVTFSIKIHIYSIIFRLVTLYSIFLVGLWKCSESQIGIMPTCYFIFISTVASISAQLNYLEAKHIINNAQDKDNDNVTLTIPKHNVICDHNQKKTKFTINEHEVKGYINK